ncbi:MAG: hypothetical protein UW39_C0021G0002 [Parcubacteria group bacterium GW2011_GWC2_44_17]|nr:MAG: hypothetical protein UW39_C0021G0002 [Parcubacteria group bacterium GW2011_GWC2_44_17]KKT48582.1 MAG: hypothetical protein UW40_C0038G0004 [Parcubacteria group bacterium GW2011_GWF2_44_17]OGY71577.1 MAG: hypothetical protein A3E05_01655 [Candidatus Jacksonbacteria bacterium RIFCSPHIGHO2_12_FULL_44_12]OGY72021.1 MAG: hypothetical protein A3C00_03410 [Candidatus Jacksonbacteria bacterium RIFCSPHIGHO2_02_FULL_44_25]HCA67684.1 hypothetical protein [Candidatus Jacksonbacteria bacterium]
MEQMKQKVLTMRIDHENGIKYVTLRDGTSHKTISISDDGAKFLDSLGADIILDFDENNNLIGIELLGL